MGQKMGERRRKEEFTEILANGTCGVGARGIDQTSHSHAAIDCSVLPIRLRRDSPLEPAGGSQALWKRGLRSIVDDMWDNYNGAQLPRASSDSGQSGCNPIDGESRLLVELADAKVSDRELKSSFLQSPGTESLTFDELGVLSDLSAPASLSHVATSPPNQLPPLPETGSLPSPRRQGSTRMKTRFVERSGSARRQSRRDSVRSGSSSMSPATAFLSQWARDDGASATEPDDEGQEIGGPGNSQYIIGKQIGYGGFSVVKEVFTMERGMGVRRAVKIVRKTVSNKSEDDNDRVQNEFEHEISIWRYLKHPHILPLICVFNTEFATFCVTKLNVGGTLYDLVRKNRKLDRKGITVDLAKRYISQISSAIHYLHEDMRIVHRDVKLENCLIDTSDVDPEHIGGRILLCDLGMADFISNEGRSSSDPDDERLCESFGPSDTSTSIAGSLQYAAPEVLNSNWPLRSPAVDMWALGVVIYALLLGDLPFQHAFQPKLRTLILKGEWDVDALRRALRDQDSAEDAFEAVAGCLHMDPGQRWTVGDMLGSAWLRGYEQHVTESEVDWG